MHWIIALSSLVQHLEFYSNVDSTHDANRTSYNCEKVKCQCIPGRMLCGEDGSIGSSTALPVSL